MNLSRNGSLRIIWNVGEINSCRNCFRGSRVGIPYLSSLRRKRSDVLRTSQLRRRRENVFIRPHDVLRTTNAHWDGIRGHEGQFYAVF